VADDRQERKEKEVLVGQRRRKLERQSNRHII